MYTVTKTLNELIKRFEAADWEDIIITMKNGDVLTVTPMAEHAYKPNKETLAYIFAVGSKYPWMNGDPEEFADKLNRYDALLEELEHSKFEIKRWYEKCTLDGTFDEDAKQYFSDWYKGIYGRRPSLTNPAFD